MEAVKLRKATQRCNISRTVILGRVGEDHLAQPLAALKDGEHENLDERWSARRIHFPGGYEEAGGAWPLHAAQFAPETFEQGKVGVVLVLRPVSPAE
jgi:hypothetical protein